MILLTIEDIIGILENLETVHQTMLEIAGCKKKAIIKNDLESLIQMMNQETKVLKQIELLESQRVEAVHQFLQEKGIKSKLNLNVSELSRLVFDVEEKNRLQSIQSRLSDTLSLLKQTNELNQKLIAQALEFIDYSLDVLVEKPYQEVTYQHPLTERNGGKFQSGYFDSRA
ncbi:FlgN protein [Paenibacillus sp. P1XP2]|nr:FlgN protein [Paenibacillus sp. P1XP2]